MTRHRTLGQPEHVFISGAPDVAWARRAVQALAAHEGLGNARAAALATAVSEIARNIVVHAGRGTMTFSPVTEGQRRGVTVVARDEGPGISDIAHAMEDGYSTAGSLGLGLSGARRLVDEFEIESAAGAGVTVTLTQWADE